MAEIKATVKVSVENIVHEMYRTLAQEIYNQHGIMVKQVDIAWMDISSLSKSTKKVTGLTMVLKTESPGG